LTGGWGRPAARMGDQIAGGEIGQEPTMLYANWADNPL
jgi:hypothetical protein